MATANITQTQTHKRMLPHRVHPELGDGRRVELVDLLAQSQRAVLAPEGHVEVRVQDCAIDGHGWRLQEALNARSRGLQSQAINQSIDQ